jgi:hypothetical protein
MWKATDQVLARPVTVRTFTAGFRRAGAVVAAARAASQLNDPRLVRIFDADARPERPYIVTEWPSGTRLDDLLAAGPLGPQRAAEIITEAADALGGRARGRAGTPVSRSGLPVVKHVRRGEDQRAGDHGGAHRGRKPLTRP